MATEIESVPAMNLSHKPESSHPSKRLKLHDFVILGILVIACALLVIFVIGRLHLKNEVAQAKIVSDKVVSAMSRQDTSAIRALGDKEFQAKNSAASLNTHLTATTQDGSRITFAQLYGNTKPVIDSQVVANNNTGQHVAIIYRYEKLKVPFYVRVEVAKTTGSSTWTLQSLSAGPAASSTDSTDSVTGT